VYNTLCYVQDFAYNEPSNSTRNFIKFRCVKLHLVRMFGLVYIFFTSLNSRTTYSKFENDVLEIGPHPFSRTTCSNFDYVVLENRCIVTEKSFPERRVRNSNTTCSISSTSFSISTTSFSNSTTSFPISTTSFSNSRTT